jgi:hypothetical protein
VTKARTMLDPLPHETPVLDPPPRVMRYVGTDPTLTGRTALVGFLADPVLVYAVFHKQGSSLFRKTDFEPMWDGVPPEADKARVHAFEIGGATYAARWVPNAGAERGMWDAGWTQASASVLAGRKARYIGRVGLVKPRAAKTHTQENANADVEPAAANAG